MNTLRPLHHIAHTAITHTAITHTALTRTAVALWTLLVLAPAAQAVTHTVCASGCDYSVIQDAVDAASAGDIVELDAETFTEGNIRINKDLTLRTGSGMATIDADGANWTLKIDPGFAVVVEDVRLEGATRGMLLNHGTTELRTVYIVGGASSSDYGGVFNGISGDLTVTDASLVASNASPTRGGGFNNYGDLLINNSTVTGNSGRRGGGVANWGGQVSVAASSFSFNHVTHRGGAWYNGVGGSLTYHSSSSYSGNTSDGSCDKYSDAPAGLCVD